LRIREELRDELNSEIENIVKSNDVDGVLNHSRKAAFRVLGGYIEEAVGYLNKRAEGISKETRQGYQIDPNGALMEEVRDGVVTVDKLVRTLTDHRVRDYKNPDKKGKIGLGKAFGWKKGRNALRRMQLGVSSASQLMKATKLDEEKILLTDMNIINSIEEFVKVAETAIDNRDIV
jgi:hypothetical protein